MMLQANTWFQMIPMTERTADVLARRHGYRSVDDLANSLPPRAEVLDVGAGASSLGSVVAGLRPDIHWVNLDFNYSDKQVLRDVSQGAPPNLEFVVGDVDKLDQYMKPGSMDAIFSYWLFPHLTRYDQQTTLSAAEQLYKVAKPGGILAVGPRKLPIFQLHPIALTGRSWRTRKEKGLTAEAYSQEVLRQSQLSVASRHVRIAFDTAAAELFGTSRYVKGSGIKGSKVYDPKTGTYISTYTPRAVYLLGSLLVGTFVRLISPRQLHGANKSVAEPADK